MLLQMQGERVGSKSLKKKDLHEYNLCESHDSALLIYNVALNQPF